MIIDHTLLEEANGTPDSWRCTSCRQLMYNIANGYPAPGGPLQYGWSGGPLEAATLCSLCAAMHNAADTNYFRMLDAQRAAKRRQEL